MQANVEDFLRYFNRNAPSMLTDEIQRRIGSYEFDWSTEEILYGIMHQAVHTVVAHMAKLRAEGATDEAAQPYPAPANLNAPSHVPAGSAGTRESMPQGLETSLHTPLSYGEPLQARRRVSNRDQPLQREHQMPMDRQALESILGSDDEAWPTDLHECTATKHPTFLEPSAWNDPLEEDVE